MSTYTNLKAAAPEDTARVIFEAGVHIGPYPGVISAFFRAIGIDYDDVKNGIYAGRVAMDNTNGSLAEKQAAAVAAVRAALP